jgi:hypothetical protein
MLLRPNNLMGVFFLLAWTFPRLQWKLDGQRLPAAFAKIGVDGYKVALVKSTWF